MPEENLFPPQQCVAKANSTGQRCQKHAIAGGTVCRLHGGSLPVVREAAFRKKEMARWGLADSVEGVDPATGLLRAVQQSAAKCELYAVYMSMAREAVETPGRGAFEIPPYMMALAGVDFRKSRDNDSALMSEVVSKFEALEYRERTFLVAACRAALAGNIAERQVRLAEVQGAALVAALLAGLDAAGLTPQQKAIAQNAAADHMARMLGPGPSAGLHVEMD